MSEPSKPTPPPETSKPPTAPPLQINVQGVADIYWLQEFLQHPRRIIWLNFILGMVRGLGFALGLTVIAGVVLTIFLKLVGHMADIPFIGTYLAELFTEIQDQMNAIKQRHP